jgi:transcriptional regulator with XRE-family HTH domain
MAKKLHIGKLIKEKMEADGMTVAELGRRLNRSSQSVYHIFRSESIDTELLAGVSKALGTDFFRYYYLEASTSTKGNITKKTTRRVTINIEVDEVEQDAILRMLGITMK